MRGRGKLGSRRVDTRLVNDVCIAEIRKLPRGFIATDASERSILGDAPKVFLEMPGGSQAYIAKGPRREGPRECVTEQLISEIGAALPVRVAKSKLARMRTRYGLVPGAMENGGKNYCPQDVRFMSQYFLSPSEQLIHGGELVAASFEIKESELRKEVVGRASERGFYTVDLIDEVFQNMSPSTTCYEALRDDFAKMMAFDSLIGANDRHPQNWGAVFNVRDTQIEPYFSPLFDSARGLFWNLTDSRMETWDRSGTRSQQIKKYAERSSPLIGIDGIPNPNHFDVIDFMVNGLDRGFAEPIRLVIRAFSQINRRNLVDGAAGRYFSRRRLEYIVELLNLRYARLLEIVDLKS